MASIRVTDIHWDTDGADADLPAEVELDLAEERIDDPDQQLGVWLSDKFGWCVKSFSYEAISTAPSLG